MSSLLPTCEAVAWQMESALRFSSGSVVPAKNKPLVSDTLSHLHP